MRHLLMRSVAVVAAAIAVATVFARNADGESAHGGTAAAASLGVAAVPLKEISIASIEAANAWNAPGGSSRTSMTVSEEQKAAIRRQLDLLGLTGVSRAGPNGSGLAIGARLPREKTRLSPLPSAIARIVPGYGSYEHFVTESGALVIVDPSTYEIVDMIGA